MTQGVNVGQTTEGSSDGSSGNPNPIPVMSMSQGVDYNNPLFLSPADTSIVNLISFQLIGIENYVLWSRSIKLALLGRNKIGLVDGSCKNKNVRGQWERVNAFVLSWLLNSVSKSLLGGVTFAFSAQGVWNDLKERFDQLDRSRTFSLHKEIATLQPGTDFVLVYFTKLKTSWDDFEAMVSFPGCNCERSRGFIDHLNRQKLYQILMGLNESFGQARSQILLMNHVPTMNQAYVRVVNDECQKVATSSSSVGLSSISGTGVDPLVMYSRTGGFSNAQGYNRFKKNFEFCRCKGHTKDQCYKLIRYPLDFKSKRKVSNVKSFKCSRKIKDMDTNQKIQVKHMKLRLIQQELYPGKVREIGKEDDENEVDISQKWLGHGSSHVLSKYVKTQFDKTVRKVRSDNGTEFMNSVCATMFKERGIIHQRSYPYTPQQNGVAEKKHRHLLKLLT
ncbi:hypothetical protein KY284_020770 [Solanum tuberosum]|nr:hypothetical protein KY284_020770 [Solanum tuberosum]